VLGSDADGLIAPGRSATVPVLVDVPGEPGIYTVRLQVERKAAAPRMAIKSLAECRINLKVTENANPLQAALAELAQEYRLPEGYASEARGRLGRLKAWLGEKLLGGFRRRYINVLSRQQSAVNGLTLTAIVKLNDSVQGLQSAAEGEDGTKGALIDLLDRVRKLERRVADLEETNARVMS
jgi:hypothetical protein